MNKVDVKAVTIRKQYLKWPFRPIFKSEKLFCNGAIAIKKGKFRIKISKQVYIETTIVYIDILLDLNKVSMLDFHYDYRKTKYGNEMEMLLIDTNSLM